MSDEYFISRIAGERNCAPELVRAILTDCLAALDETAFKRGIGIIQIELFQNLGHLAAYHLTGLMSEAAQFGSGEIIEQYNRLDHSKEQFKEIREQWEYELGREREDGQ